MWQAKANEFTAKEQQEVLRKRISLQRISSSLNQLIDGSMAGIQRMLSTSVLNRDKRASLASQCSKTITQYKYDLMMLTMSTRENIIRGHVQKFADLKEKFLLVNHDNLQVSSDQFIKAIEERAEIMRKRFETMLQYKLKTFFDEAPTTSSE